MNKAENPLYPIARTKHKEDIASREFIFVENTGNNSDTYTLGFCRGVSYMADIMNEKLAALQKAYDELNAIYQNKEKSY